MSAALRRLVGESKHLGEHYRFFALPETSVTSCATSLSHCLRLFCILTLPIPKYHNCDALSELKNSFHKLFWKNKTKHIHTHSSRPSIVCEDRHAWEPKWRNILSKKNCISLIPTTCSIFMPFAGWKIKTCNILMHPYTKTINKMIVDLLILKIIFYFLSDLWLKQSAITDLSFCTDLWNNRIIWVLLEILNTVEKIYLLWITMAPMCICHW